MGEKQENTFQTLKNYLVTAPVLWYPDYSKTFYLYTNASGVGLRAVLAQKGEDKKEYAIAYASKSLTRAERNYATTKLECYAIIWGVEYFHHYLGYKPFIIVTNHAALKWLQTTVPKGRRARWILRIQPYNYTIIHQASQKHIMPMLITIPAQVVNGGVQNYFPKNSPKYGAFNMDEAVEVFYTAAENHSPDNSDNELSDWIQEADSSGWFDEEKELQIDAE